MQPQDKKAKPDTDGNLPTRRDHWLSIAGQTGTMPAELVIPPCPSMLAHIVQCFFGSDKRLRIGGWFGELSETRPSGFGAGAITYAEIDAWARLTGRSPTRFEVYVLRRADAAFVAMSDG